MRDGVSSIRMEPSHSRETRTSWTTTEGAARDITGRRVGMLILGTRFNMVNAGGGQSVSQVGKFGVVFFFCHEK